MRPFHHALAAGAVAGTLLFSGCADPLNWGSEFAPKPSTHTPAPTGTSGPATAPSTPSGAPSTPSAPTSVPTATGKASGSMKLYTNLVTKRLSGTCTVGDAITIAVGDHANDFYGTVDLTVVLEPDASAVDSIMSVFGEDSEGITRQISYTADSQAKGTSAKVTAVGQRYQVSGTGLAVETRNGKQTSRLIPYSLDLTCTVKS